MYDLEIKELNAATIKIISNNDGIKTHLYEYFRYVKPNHNAYFSKWDGYVRLYDKRKDTLPYGLLIRLLSLCKKMGYKFKLDEEIKENLVTNVTLEQIQSWVDTLTITSKGNVIKPYDYQVKSVHHAIRHNRSTILSATSSGKSLIIYLVTRFYHEIGYDNGKTLIIVPTVNLVNQLYQDFRDYTSQDDMFHVEQLVHTIHEGIDKYSNKNIFISTWQSLIDIEDEYFSQFANLIIDECHLASGKSITKIADNSINAYNRLGLTGTLNGTELHEVQVTSLLGDVKSIIRTKELQDRGLATQTKVTMIEFYYCDDERSAVSKLNYDAEVDYIMAHTKRNQTIIQMAKKLEGNSLFLFNRREKHLDMIYEELISMNLPNTRIELLVGGMGSGRSEEIKKLTEETDDRIIILGIDKTASTGISINKLNNLVICYSTKSVITILQSLGRLLRLHKTKSIANIIDLCDNFTWKSKKNSCYKHAMERYKFYHNEQHKVEIKRINI